MDLTDRVAIVTGAGRGIGRGIALVMARCGASVVAADMNFDDASNVAAEIAEMGRESDSIQGRRHHAGRSGRSGGVRH